MYVAVTFNNCFLTTTQCSSVISAIILDQANVKEGVAFIPIVGIGKTQEEMMHFLACSLSFSFKHLSTKQQLNNMFKYWVF